jgi:hypothetical protein
VELTPDNPIRRGDLAHARALMADTTYPLDPLPPLAQRVVDRGSRACSPTEHALLRERFDALVARRQAANDEDGREFMARLITGEPAILHARPPELLPELDAQIEATAAAILAAERDDVGV